ncbi:ECF RNA polymerase sigma factor SigE [Polystyrenella longa]|uniref:ECF RNA polymerase sigma factor SigE n=1 Tax=Polystyrenella longa TaxID=2528007 RepID=A0A518CKQ1_9PLAN|nr:sigma-70 family RNA polymerase sigma factor [Polystyrenella longa]QDU79798.1 ECF RNA polymerase sigma factor SigE [Polystyrenella longa]
MNLHEERPIKSSCCDSELLGRVVSERDVSALESLIHRYSGLVMGIARQLLHRPEDAEEAFQSTFLKLTEKAPEIKDAQALAGWLLRVARNESYQLLRGQQRAPLHFESTVLEQTVIAPVENENQQDVQLLLDEVEQLPEQYQSAIILCYLEGKTHEEAARQLDLTSVTVKGRLERGRKLLKQRLLKRGVGLAVLLAAWEGQQATAAAVVSTALIQQTASACAGSMLVSTGVTASAVVAKGTITTTLVGGKKFLAGVVVILLAISGGSTYLLSGSAEKQIEVVAKPEKVEQAEGRISENGIPPAEGVSKEMQELIAKVREEEAKYNYIEFFQKAETEEYGPLVDPLSGSNLDPRQPTGYITNNQLNDENSVVFSKLWIGEMLVCRQRNKFRLNSPAKQIDSVIHTDENGEKTQKYMTRLTRTIQTYYDDNRYQRIYIDDYNLPSTDRVCSLPMHGVSDPHTKIPCFNLGLSGIRLSDILRGGTEYVEPWTQVKSSVIVVSKIVKKTEINGEPIIVVRSDYLGTMGDDDEIYRYLAVNKNYIPMRVFHWENRSDGSRELSDEWNVSEWQEIKPGIWFPIKIESKRKKIGGSEDSGLFKQTRFEYEVLSLNPNYPDEFFRYQEPAD